MDGFNEKKWFVYLGDHHEGPLSLSEIQSKMAQGQVTASNYVWAEGMPDWKIMTDVSAFESLRQPPPAPVAPSQPSIEPSPPSFAQAIAVAEAEPSITISEASPSIVALSVPSQTDEKTGD